MSKTARTGDILEPVHLEFYIFLNQVQTDYTSVAYWHQSEPHTPFPALLSPEMRMPAPVGTNALQFALFSSPVWVPAAWLGVKLLKRILR